MRIVSFLFVISLLMPAEGWAADTFKLDYISYSDPDVPTIDPIVVYDQRCLDLWRQALNRPEVDLQCRASATIAQAFQMGMPAVDSLIPDLRKRLTADDTTLPARFAVARTLIMLKDRESAATLFHRSQQGNQSLRQLVEPVLAEWNHEPMRALWTQRLSDRNVRRQDLILAMRGLAQVKDPQASPQLLALVHDRQQPLAVRLTAAEAVGRIQPTELEDDARRQLVQPETATRLCAIALLSEHGSTAARDMLAAMVNEPEPTVASKALACLRVIDPERALMFAELAMRHQDANVRREGIELYLGSPTPERISFVGRLLDDPHPGLRRHIRDVFLSLAPQAELKSAILSVSRTVLAEPSWRGQEQALLVLSTLNDRTSAT
ncbi:MAG TPA: HEAT repeat domain-containing protein, partial [Planctomycetaceae bacterium]|nr:HEAT repeat domain-containing protein [Planctomycetaceae bacterium]